MPVFQEYEVEIFSKLIKFLLQSHFLSIKNSRSKELVSTVKIFMACSFNMIVH